MRRVATRREEVCPPPARLSFPPPRPESPPLPASPPACPTPPPTHPQPACTLTTARLGSWRREEYVRLVQMRWVSAPPDGALYLAAPSRGGSGRNCASPDLCERGIEFPSERGRGKALALGGEMVVMLRFASHRVPSIFGTKWAVTV